MCCTIWYRMICNDDFLNWQELAIFYKHKHEKIDMACDLKITPSNSSRQLMIHFQ